MENFVEIIAFKYGEVKKPITINVNCIKAVLKEGGAFYGKGGFGLGE